MGNRDGRPNVLDIFVTRPVLAVVLSLTFVLAGLMAVAIGALVGTLAGLFGGWVDGWLMRGTDLVLSVPRLFLALMLIALYGASLTTTILVLGATSVFAWVPVPADTAPLGLASGWWDLGIMTGLTLLLWPLAVTDDQRILKREGLLLLLCYVAWLGWGVWREVH